MSPPSWDRPDPAPPRPAPPLDSVTVTVDSQESKARRPPNRGPRLEGLVDRRTSDPTILARARWFGRIHLPRDNSLEIRWCAVTGGRLSLIRLPVDVRSGSRRCWKVQTCGQSDHRRGRLRNFSSVSASQFARCWELGTGEPGNRKALAVWKTLFLCQRALFRPRLRDMEASGAMGIFDENLFRGDDGVRRAMRRVGGGLI